MKQFFDPPQPIQVQSTNGALEFQIEPHVRYNVRINLNASGMNTEVVLTDDKGRDQSPLYFTAKTEIRIDNSLYTKITFQDATPYVINVVTQRVIFDECTNMSEVQCNLDIREADSSLVKTIDLTSGNAQIQISKDNAGLAKDATMRQIKLANIEKATYTGGTLIL